MVSFYLKSIGGNAYFGPSKITDLKNLQFIGGDAHFENSSTITSLNNLQTIVGNAVFNYSPIIDFGKLEMIGGNLWMGYTKKITSLGNLKSVGGTVEICNSNLTKNDFHSIKFKQFV